jgi:hypothetical protein
MPWYLMAIRDLAASQVMYIDPHAIDLRGSEAIYPNGLLLFREHSKMDHQWRRGIDGCGNNSGFAREKMAGISVTQFANE